MGGETPNVESLDIWLHCPTALRHVGVPVDHLSDLPRKFLSLYVDKCLASSRATWLKGTPASR